MADWLKKFEFKAPEKETDVAKIVKIVLIVLGCLLLAAGIAVLVYKLVLKFQEEECGDYGDGEDEDDFFEGEDE
ncbi:MAG: hypothetical protein IK088_07900 [Lachnospiraceae bacterium]|nr:hypothetical protein [Lachnospiraceae bacterium]